MKYDEMLILRQDMVILDILGWFKKFKVWTWDNIVMFCAEKRNGILTSYSHIQWSTWLKQQRDDDFHDVQKNIESQMSSSHCLIDLSGYYQLYYNRMAFFPLYWWYTSHRLPKATNHYQLIKASMVNLQWGTPKKIYWGRKPNRGRVGRPSNRGAS